MYDNIEVLTARGNLYLYDSAWIIPVDALESGRHSGKTPAYPIVNPNGFGFLVWGSGFRSSSRVYCLGLPAEGAQAVCEGLQGYLNLPKPTFFVGSL